MKYNALALPALAAAADALLSLNADIKLPLGIELPINLDVGPKGSPPDDCIDVWHPPHHGVDMDGCDNEGDDDWHWVHPGKPSYPDQGEYVWTTKAVATTHVSTVIDCPTNVPHCPGRNTHYTTVVVPETTTICPVPVETEYPAPTKDKAYPVPTKQMEHTTPIEDKEYPSPTEEKDCTTEEKEYPSLTEEKEYTTPTEKAYPSPTETEIYPEPTKGYPQKPEEPTHVHLDESTSYPPEEVTKPVYTPIETPEKPAYPTEKPKYTLEKSSGGKPEYVPETPAYTPEEPAAPTGGKPDYVPEEKPETPTAKPYYPPVEQPHYPSNPVSPPAEIGAYPPPPPGTPTAEKPVYCPGPGCPSYTTVGTVKTLGYATPTAPVVVDGAAQNVHSVAGIVAVAAVAAAVLF
ncbi:hypothetical protein ACJ41O_009940 [Fusarium nematophilum]